jgi:hypothetical protein
MDYLLFFNSSLEKFINIEIYSFPKLLGIQ